MPRADERTEGRVDGWTDGLKVLKRLWNTILSSDGIRRTDMWRQRERARDRVREKVKERERERERWRACERVDQLSLYIAPGFACVNWGLMKQSSHKGALVNIPTLSYQVMPPSPPPVGQPCNFKFRSFETIILSPASGWVIDMLKQDAKVKFETDNGNRPAGHSTTAVVLYLISLTSLIF